MQFQPLELLHNHQFQKEEKKLDLIFKISLPILFSPTERAPASLLLCRCAHPAPP